jgi:HSP20 family protein
MDFAEKEFACLQAGACGPSAGQLTEASADGENIFRRERMITMTALTQWNPFAEMEEMQNRLSAFPEFAPVRNGSHAPAAEEWAPPIDVIETADEYLIQADLPGVNKGDLSVTLQRGELTLMGTRAAEPLAEGARYVFNERPYGTFTRTFVVPEWADASHIQAEFKHGVLTVKLQKAEQAKPRAIAITGE